MPINFLYCVVYRINRKEFNWIRVGCIKMALQKNFTTLDVSHAQSTILPVSNKVYRFKKLNFN